MMSFRYLGRRLVGKMPVHHVSAHALDPGSGSDAAGAVQERAVLAELRRQTVLHGLLELRCADIMRAPVITVRPDDTKAHAEALLARYRFKLLPVIDASGRLAGVVSRADLRRVTGHLHAVSEALAGGTPPATAADGVAGIMSASVATVFSDEKLTDIVPRFMAKGHHHLPVIDRHRRVVGMLTQSDIFALMCDLNPMRKPVIGSAVDSLDDSLDVFVPGREAVKHGSLLHAPRPDEQRRHH
jgi:CBS domain-containing protein